MKKLTRLLLFLMLMSGRSHALSVNISKLDDACNTNIGWIIAGASGGTNPYIFIWSNGAYDSTGTSYEDTLFNVGAGNYTVTIFDAVGDSATASITVGNTPSLDRNGTIMGIFTNIDPISGAPGFSCPGIANGILFCPISYFTNGTEPFNVTSSPSGAYIASTPTYGEHVVIPNLMGGQQFYMSVTDNNGCSGSFTDFEYGPPPYPFNTINVLPACNGQNNGSVYIDNPTGFFMIDVMITDSTSGAFVLSQQVSNLGTNLISNALYPGTYMIQMTYNYTVTPCPETGYFTIPDAGTNCGVISGNVYADTIHNCIHDGNEPGIPSQIIELTPGPYYATTNSSGNYSVQLPYNTYSLTQVNPPSNYFANCIPAPVVINSLTPNATANFGDSLNMNLDLRIGISSGTARPGFPLGYSVSVTNFSLISSGAALVTFTADTILQFVSCNYPYTYLGNGMYTVQLLPLASYGTSNIQFNFTVPPNPSLIGNTLAASASVTNPVFEPNLSNNSSAQNQIITGAVDPNEKTVWPARNLSNVFFTDIDSLLTYTIHFQNTGTDTAFTVVITDTLSTYVDITTLDIKASSHAMTWSFEGEGVLKFTFANILLADSNINEPLSHGWVSYSIRPNSNLTLLTVIPNTAAIYFDFNPPIITNTITSLIDISVGVTENTLQNEVTLLPNPTTSEVIMHVKENADNTLYALKLFNIQGTEVMNLKKITSQSRIRLNHLSAGCYFYSITKEDGSNIASQGKLTIVR